MIVKDRVPLARLSRFVRTRATLMHRTQLSLLFQKYGPHSWVVGRSTHAVACAFASKPQPRRNQKCVLENKPETKNHSRAVACTVKSCTSTRAVACTVKKKSAPSSTIMEVPLEKQRSAPESAALELQRSSAPTVRDQNNIETGFGPNDDEWKRLQRNKFGGECHNNTWGPTQCSDEPITQGLEVCLDKKTPQQ